MDCFTQISVAGVVAKKRPKRDGTVKLHDAAWVE